MVKSISEPSTKAIVDLRTALRQTIRVLHVDDDSGFLKVAKSFLEAQGPFEVETVLSVEEALRKLGETEYDVVISDYQMSGKDGLQFLKELREKGNNIPFIIFTGKGREEVAIRALNLGADNYVDKHGGPETVYTELAHDILSAVEKVKAKEALLKSEEKYRSLVNNAGIAIAVSDLRGRLTYVNPTLTGLWDYSAREMLGRPWTDFLHADDRVKVLRLFQEIIVSRKEPRTFEFRGIRKDGDVLYLMTKPTRFEINGKVLGFQAIIIDITERKKAEEELLKQKEKVEKYLNIVGNAVVALDSDGTITLLNRKGYEILGYKEGELVGKDWFETCLPKENKEEVKRFFKALIKGQVEPSEQHENSVLTRNGEKRTVSWYNRVLKDDDGKIIGTLSSGEDITERNKTLEVLEKNEESLRLALKAAGAGVWNHDFLEKESTWSPELYVVHGVRQGCLETSRESWLKHVHPEHRSRINNEIWDSIENKRDFNAEYRTVWPDGTRHWISEKGRAYYDGEGRPLRMIGISTDITERKNVEESLRNSERKLGMMNERLRVVGGLTRHDVRNKLSAIVGNTYLARRAPDRKNETLEYLQEIDQEVEQIVRILDFAKAYEMLGSKRLAYVDVEKAFKEAISAFPGLETVKVTNDCNGLSVRADSLLVQLFYNLIDNSLKHGEKLTKIKVHCADYGDQLNLIYEDDGVGIPRKTKLRLFSEGFTTGKGSGYGLYLIRRMMEIYGWAIQETGESGIGARFVITIPRTNSNGKENYRIA
jgi:PAS domain S-box-containing protein